MMVLFEAGDTPGNWSGPELALAAVVIVVVCAALCRFLLD